MKITKTRIKTIYHKIDNKIVGSITRLGSSEKSIAIKHPQIVVKGERELDDLVKAANRYDIEDFFVLHKTKSKRELKTGYRIALKSYQGLRDGGVLVVKKLYKMRYDR